MFCSNCGKELIGSEKFCSACGWQVNNMNMTSGVNDSVEKAYSKTDDDSIDDNRVESVTQNNQKSSDEIYKRLVYAYINRNASNMEETHAAKHYYEAFYKIKTLNKNTGWNWAAFWLEGFNFLYRKSYSMGVLFLVLPILIVSILDISTESALGNAIVFGIAGICGTYGDKIHYNRFADKLKEAELKYPNDIDGQCKFLASEN